MKNKEHELRDMLDQWKVMYIATLKNDNYKQLHWAIFDDNNPSQDTSLNFIEQDTTLSSNEINIIKNAIKDVDYGQYKYERKRTRYYERCLDTQVTFIECMVMQKNDTIQNISNFLDNQIAVSAAAPFIVTFWGDKQVVPVIVRLSHIGEISFSAAWANLHFEVIGIAHALYRKWSQVRIQTIVSHIERDFASGKVPVAIQIEENKKGIAANSELALLCRITSDDVIEELPT